MDSAEIFRHIADGGSATRSGERNLMLTENVEQRKTLPNRFDIFLSPPKRYVYGLTVILAIYVAVRSVVGAALKPFFFDEIITYAVASQSNVRDIWRSLSQAIDSQPPLFYLIERVSLGSFHNPQIALRMPSTLALACTLICVSVYLKRRNSAAVALLCTVSLLLTSLLSNYAINARGYSIVVACIALALVCYQRLPSVLWAMLLGLSLFLAESVHYYAVFSMLPFVIAEAFYFLKERRVRWQVWAALIFGLIPLFVFWPLLNSLRNYYGAHIWAHTNLSNIPVLYGYFFSVGSPFGFAVALMCAAGVIGARFLPGPESLVGISRVGDRVEGVLLLGLLFVPFTTLLLTKMLHGILLDRYVLSTILGVVIAMACVMSLARAQIIALFAVFILSSVGVHELSFWRSAHGAHLNDPAASVESFVQKANESDLPVVISDGLLYLQLAHYASPEWKKRFVYLLDESKAVQYLDTDSIDKNLVVLRRYMPLETQELSQFARAHSKFLLYVGDPKEGFNWLPEYLLAANSSMTVLESDPSRKLYLVTLR
jgi:hypothetical protein